MIGPDGFGDAVVRRHDDGRLEVVEADDVIGISLELLVEAVGSGIWVDGDGHLWLAGDPRYRYRPVRLWARVGNVPPGHAVEGARMLICERVK